MGSAIVTANLPDIGQRRAPVEQVGLVISTCGTPAYVHLQLEQAKRFFGKGGIPTLVYNDGDTDKHCAGRLRDLCDEYGADFHCEPYAGHTRGDLKAFMFGLSWADAIGVTILAKFSRRFVPLRHWRHELHHLAAVNQHAAAFGRYDDDNPHKLFRTDAIALRVQKWQGKRVADTFKDMLDCPKSLHVENMFNSFMKTLGGYEIWPLLGQDFYRAHRDALQWRGILPSIYGDVARGLGLDYQDADFTEEGGGVLIQNEPGEVDCKPPNVKGYSTRLSPDAVERARESEFRERITVGGDIAEHLPLLRRIAVLSPHITEFGVRGGNSTVALLAGCPVKLVAYDVAQIPEIGNLFQIAGDTEIHFVQADVLKVEIEPTDFLMIDTLHTYSQLKEELRLHGNKARRFLAFHDTETFRYKGEDDSEPGIYQAITEFLAENPSWRMIHDKKNCNGLVVLERTCKNLPALERMPIRASLMSRSAEWFGSLAKSLRGRARKWFGSLPVIRKRR